MHEASVVIVCHPDLLSHDPAVWKPMYKRLCGIAKLKGHPLARGIPALGYASFDGTRFRRSAFVAFEFPSPQQENEFLMRVMPRIDKLRVTTSPKSQWFTLASGL
jgi:hypothetical protein